MAVTYESSRAPPGGIDSQDHTWEYRREREVMRGWLQAQQRRSSAALERRWSSVERVMSIMDAEI